MKNKLTIAIALCLMFLLTASVVLAGAKFKKATRGVLESGDLVAYASCWAGATGGTGDCQPVKKYSGRIWTAEGKIEGIGKATVEVSASWDWGRSTPSGETNEIYTSDHHGALLVTTSQAFSDAKDDTPHDGIFDATATVTITDKKGDVINGNITGGSVYELVVHSPGPGSINEWLINFEIVGGTGKYESANGTGVYRMVWDSNKEAGAYDDGGYGDPARFLEQEIFLHLNK